MKEIWKNINNYDGFYQVSNLGRVKRVVSRNRPTEKIRKIQYKKNGYAVVMLTINQKYKLKHIHRLVAQAFIPNPENKPEVNHKDLNKQNNNYLNLEWCTKLENMQHAHINKVWSNNTISGYGNKKNKKVYQYNKSGEFIKEYYSITNASELNNISLSLIVLCCQNKRLSSGGYIWSYNKENKKKYKRSRGRKVSKISERETVIYDTIQIAALKNNLNPPNIIACCIGKTKTCGGFKWMYI